ncbi:MAG: hypothetical protein AAF089_10275 [Bacteroidota bacterium]
MFDYIDEYVHQIEAWLLVNEPDEAQLRRYMLAGLFLLYRSKNWTDGTVSTDLAVWETAWYPHPGKEVFGRRFEILNEYLDKPIATTREYLGLIGLKKPRGLQLIAGGGLFDFVVTGSYSEGAPDT